MGIDPVDNNYGNYSGVSKPTPDQYGLYPPKDCNPYWVFLYFSNSLDYCNRMNPGDRTDHDTIASFQTIALDMRGKYLTPQDQESLQSVIAQVQAILNKFDSQ